MRSISGSMGVPLSLRCCPVWVAIGLENLHKPVAMPPNKETEGNQKPAPLPGTRCFFSYPLVIMHSIPKAGSGSCTGMVLPLFE